MEEYQFYRRPSMALKSFYNFSDIVEEFLEDFSFNAPSKLPDVFVSSSFPPCNIVKKEDNSLEYQFAVAGYSLEEIAIQFNNDHLILSLNPTKREEDKTVKYRQKGIRRSNSESRFFVPISHYDVEKAEAKLDKGILTISIPTKEIAKPKDIKISIV